MPLISRTMLAISRALTLYPCRIFYPFNLFGRMDGILKSPKGMSEG